MEKKDVLKKERNKRYYEKHKEELRKKRNEKYRKNKKQYVLKISRKFFKRSINSIKYKLTDNYLESRIFCSYDAVQRIIEKYNLEEVEIINV